jgi:CRISPR/Cas system-associated exonuclease Cas4 (RecB family)
MDYISYSQYNSYTACPRRWYLGYVAKAEELQTWYLPIGTAVHQMIEAYLGGTLSSQLTPAKFFYPLIEKQMLIEPDTSKWMAGGSKEEPVTEERALKRVQECFEKALSFLEDIEVWEVEADLSWKLPGLEVPIKAFVDIVGEHQTKGPVILDWKTGSSKPNNFQLETYAALLMENNSLPYATEEFKGRYAMLSPQYTSTTRYVDLSKVDPAKVGAKYQKVYEQIKKKIYKPVVGFDCKFCYHRENCIAKSGLTKRSMHYDRAHVDGIPY